MTEIRSYASKVITGIEVCESGLAANLTIWDELNECTEYRNVALLPNGWQLGKTDKTFSKDYGTEGSCKYGIWSLDEVTRKLSAQSLKGLIWQDLMVTCLQSSIWMPIHNEVISKCIDTVIKNCLRKYAGYDYEA